MIKIREINAKIVGATKKMQAHYTGRPRLKAYPEEICPICRVFKNDREYIPNMTVMMVKLSKFLEDFVFFYPKPDF